MIPLHDLNPTRRTPFVTWLLIAINVVVFLWQSTLSEEALYAVFMEYAVVPASISPAFFAPESLLDMVRSMFLHGDWLHLIGNMLYLYLFGDNIEDRFGIPIYLAVYFASGMAAVFLQVVSDPQSTIPMIGASGAIAGILGAYLVMFPGVQVRALIPLGRVSTLTTVPAIIVLGLWFVLQIVEVSMRPVGGGGVAYFAHIGGFIFGAVVTFVLNIIVPQPPASNRRDMLYQRADRYRY